MRAVEQFPSFARSFCRSPLPKSARRFVQSTPEARRRAISLFTCASILPAATSASSPVCQNKAEAGWPSHFHHLRARLSRLPRQEPDRRFAGAHRKHAVEPITSSAYASSPPAATGAGSSICPMQIGSVPPSPFHLSRTHSSTRRSRNRLADLPEHLGNTRWAISIIHVHVRPACRNRSCLASLPKQIGSVRWSHFHRSRARSSCPPRQEPDRQFTKSKPKARGRAIPSSAYMFISRAAEPCHLPRAHLSRLPICQSKTSACGRAIPSFSCVFIRLPRQEPTHQFAKANRKRPVESVHHSSARSAAHRYKNLFNI